MYVCVCVCKRTGVCLLECARVLVCGGLHTPSRWGMVVSHSHAFIIENRAEWQRVQDGLVVIERPYLPNTSHMSASPTPLPATSPTASAAALPLRSRP